MSLSKDIHVYSSSYMCITVYKPAISPMVTLRMFEEYTHRKGDSMSVTLHGDDCITDQAGEQNAICDCGLTGSVLKIKAGEWCVRVDQ